jgi:hypothetical protein
VISSTFSKFYACSFLFLSLILLAGCASTPSASPRDVPLTAAESRAQETRDFGVAMTAAKDANVQNMLILAWALRGNNNNNSQSVMQHNGATFWDFANETRRDLVSVVPSILSYKGAVRASESSERVNESNARVSIANSNNFLALGVAGISGSSAIGTALAIRPSPAVTPTTQITVSGNSGAVNLGNGTQLNSSHNPITNNPTPRVCVVGATPPCS